MSALECDLLRGPTRGHQGEVLGLPWLLEAIRSSSSPGARVVLARDHEFRRSRHLGGKAPTFLSQDQRLWYGGTLLSSRRPIWPDPQATQSIEACGERPVRLP